MKRISPLVVLLVPLVVLAWAGVAVAQDTEIEYGATAPLACGWNMLGLPIDGPTAVADCQVRDESGETLSMAEAAAAGWIELPAYTYDGRGYQSCGVNPWNVSNAFRPWTGYWIYVCRCGIRIIYPIPIRVPWGSGVALKTDRPIYDLCPACTVIPRPIRMCLVVFNTTCIPVTYTFSSSQEFDFEIVDPTGKVIWRWSDGQAFLPVVHKIALCACCLGPADMACRMCIIGYAEFVPFDPESDRVLPEGLYTLRGWLTADKTMEARATFEIRYGARN
jgi:hypothetical protein